MQTLIKKNREERPHDFEPVPVAFSGCSDELRCGCGSLLARLVGEGVELKCRRCKRTLVLSLQALQQTNVVEMWPLGKRNEVLR
jgi:phage FluMu protein Com